MTKADLRDWPGAFHWLGSSSPVSRWPPMVSTCPPCGPQGYGGLVNSFLSWPLWAPLSRLTYSCYLIHLEILPMFSASVLSFYPFDVSTTLPLSSLPPRSPCSPAFSTSSVVSPFPLVPLPSLSLPSSSPSPGWRSYW